MPKKIFFMSPVSISRLPCAGSKFTVPQIPFDNFTYTRRGEHFEGNIDEFHRDRVSMVGISVLGGNAGLEGLYELGIDEIWATNEEFSPAKVCSVRLYLRAFSHILTHPGRPVRGDTELLCGPKPPSIRHDKSTQFVSLV